MRGRISRRTALGALLAAPAATAAPALRAEDLRVLAEAPHEMMQDYLLRLAAEATARRQARLQALRSKEEIRTWQDENRARFIDRIGGLPSERTPLRPRAMGTLAREGYEIRKLMFESLPEFYVTANLYVPRAGKPPYPAVLAPLGHAANSKAYAEYQRLFIGLVRQGYVVFTWDTIGQGERFQLWDYVFRHRGLTEKTNEHGILGIREYLLGQNLSRYLIWDGLRALDYLAALDVVDAARIGCTGNSGGGTLTTYLTMLDPRIKVASIVTYITSIPRKIDARIQDAEADPEQDVQGILAAGIDHTEQAGMIAPRPLLIGAALRDFFPIQGTRETFAELQKLYALAGAADHVDMVAFDHQHMYSQPLREATTRWFNRWLRGVDGEVHEQPATLEPDRSLECTDTGQVLTSAGGRRLVDFDREEARRLTARPRRDIVAAVKKRLALPDTAAAESEKIAESDAGGLHIEKLVLRPEPGIIVPVRSISGTGSGTIVYLRDRDGERDAPELLARLAAKAHSVLSADVRGFGETKTPRDVPDKRMYYYHPRDGMDADYAYAALTLGRPLPGMRVADALAVVKFAQARAGAGRITLIGRGWAALVALFCAAVEPGIGRLAIEGFPASYAEWATSESYAQAVSQVIPGALIDFDIADVLASIAPRPVLAINAQDAQTRNTTALAPTEAEVWRTIENWL